MEEDLPVVTIILERGDTGLGFNIKGGIDANHVPKETGIFVTKIRENGAAFKDGRIKEGDRVVEINQENIEAVAHSDAVQLFVNSGNRVELKVQHGAEAILRERLRLKGNEEDDNSTTSTLLKLGLAGVSVTIALFLAYRFLKKGSLLSR